MDSNKYSVKVGIKLAENAVANVQKDLNEKLKDSKFEVSFSSKGLDDISKKLDEISSKLTKVSGKNNFKKTGDSAKDAAKGVDKLNQNLEKTGKHLKNQAFATDNLAYNWSKAMQSFLAYNTVTQFFNTVSNGIKDMIGQVKELDDALTEFKKVSDLSGESLDKYVDKAYKMGATVAKTGTEMIEAATSFKKSGYTDDMSLELGKVATMYTNIADEAISSAEAADFVIAQMKAFKLETGSATETLENAYHVIDSVNEVSNNFAVSSADIATNLGKASAVMANAGNSLEQMIGLMTAGTEITRNGSKVANGLKTLTLRLQGMNDEGEKDLELQAQMEALFQKLGISVYDANGQLKNTYEILSTLAPVYETLTNAEKAYVTETIAGKYQAQNAAAILSNWKVAVDATTTALNSNGSAARENENVLDSIQGHLQKLNSAWEELSRNLFNSDLLKFIIDLGTAFLKLANSGVGKFIIKMTAGIVIYKLATTALQKLSTTIVLTAAKQQLLAGNTQKVTKEMLKEKAASMTLGGSLKQLGGTGVSALKSLAVSPLGWVSAGITVVTALVTVFKELDEKQHEAAQKTVEAAGELDDKLSNLDEMATKIQELRSVTDSSTSSYEDATKAREELNKIQKQLIEDYGAEADKIDLVNGSISEQIEELKKLKKEAAQDYLDKNRDEYNNAKYKLYDKNRMRQLQGSDSTRALGTENRWETDVKSITFLGKNAKKEKQKYIDEQKFFNEYVDNYKEIMNKYGKVKEEANKNNGKTELTFVSDNADSEKKALEEWKKYLSDNEKEIVNSGIMTQKEFDRALEYTTDNIGVLEKRYADYYNVLKEYQKEQLTAAGYDDFIADVKELSNTEELNKENVQKLINKYDGLGKALKSNGISVKKIIKEYQNVGKVVSENSKDIEDATKLFSDEGMTRSQILKLKDNKNASKDLTDAYKSLKKIADDSGISMEALINYLVQTKQVAKDTNEEVVKTVDTVLKEFDTDISSIADKYGVLTSAAEEFNSNGYITVDTFKSLMDNNLWQYLDWTANGLNANTDALINEADAAKYNAFVALQDAFAKDALAIATGDVSNQSEIAKAAVAGLKGEMDSAGLIAQARAGNLFTYAGAIQAIKDAEKGKDLSDADIEKKAGQLKNLATAYNNAAKGIANINLQASAKKSRGSGGGGSSSSKSEKEWWEKAYDDLKAQFDYSDITIEQYIGGLENLLGKLDKGSDAWKKINKELQKAKLDKVKDDYNAGRISLNQYIISLQNLQKAYKEGTDAWNDLADAIKKAKLDKLKEQQNDLKSALSAVNDTLDKQIDKYEEAKDAADKKYDDEIDKLEELQDKLDDQNDDYERAQQAVADYLDEQMNAMEKQRDTVESYYDNVLDAIEKMNEKQQESLELAEAYEALMNAMTQKTKKVYKEGLGWIWTTDAEAIRDAKQTYEDLLKNATTKEIEEQKDATINSLEEQINALQDYIDSWDKVLDKFDNEKNRNLADLLLGENWTEMVSQLDPQIVDDFSDAYYELQKNLEETEKQIEELNKKKEEEDEYWDKLIDDLEEYKDKWSDVADIYEEAQNALKARQIMGANWEQDILNRRLDVLENFKNKYNAILAEIDKVDNMSTNQASNYTALRLPGYANGGEVDYTGLAVLHGTPNKPEYVLNNNQMRNLLGNLTKPRFTSNLEKSSSVVNNYSFGNIELPNVTNARQFANELKSLLNITKNQ